MESRRVLFRSLDELNTAIVGTVKSGQAIEASNLFTFDNSLAQGRKMTADLSTLLLRAYHAEADNSVRALRVGNVTTARKRLESSRVANAQLGAMMEMRLGVGVHPLLLAQIDQTACWVMSERGVGEHRRR